jgi:hypothetical protein
VGESDFHQLKKDQSILVEFPLFADHLIETILLCNDHFTGITGSNGTNTTATRTSKSVFNAKLDTTEEKFSIIEVNSFKQITHISLKVSIFILYQPYVFDSL